MEWARRMTCLYCHTLIADHPWPGGFHLELVGEKLAKRKGIR